MVSVVVATWSFWLMGKSTVFQDPGQQGSFVMRVFVCVCVKYVASLCHSGRVNAVGCIYTCYPFRRLPEKFKTFTLSLNKCVWQAVTTSDQFVWGTILVLMNCLNSSSSYSSCPKHEVKTTICYYVLSKRKMIRNAKNARLPCCCCMLFASGTCIAQPSRNSFGTSFASSCLPVYPSLWLAWAVHALLQMFAADVLHLNSALPGFEISNAMLSQACPPNTPLPGSCCSFWLPVVEPEMTVGLNYIPCIPKGFVIGVRT